jgi:diguanylate cyclase (GGDEF)-like protein/PAS domain S-box-containing protein
MSSSAVGRAVLAALPVGVVIHGGDGRIIRCNAAAERVLGMSESQMMGLDSMDPSWHAIHEDGTVFAREMHPALVTARTGEPVEGVVLGVHKPDGTLTWISINAVRIAVAAGESEPAVLATFADITEQVRLRDAAREAEARYRLLAENATDVVIRVRDRIIIWASPSVHSALGWEPEDWVGASMTEFVHPDDVDSLRDAILAAEGGEHVTYRVRARAADGAHHWVEGRGRVFLDASGQPDGRISSLRIVDNEVAVEEALHDKAIHDDLTGLLSRGEMLERLDAVLSHPPRSGGQIAVAFCDVDDFKNVNDHYGHGVGDEALRVLGQRIRAMVRETDLVARFGGDEILVVLDAVTVDDDALAIAEKIRAAAQLPIPILGGACHVTLSIGITLAAPGDTVDSLIARSDEGLYNAKVRGKNQVVHIPAHRS